MYCIFSYKLLIMTVDSQRSEDACDNGQAPAPPFITKSQKGSDKLWYAGFSYTRHPRKHEGTIRWRCTKRLLRCPGILLTDDLIAHPQQSIEHNHVAETAGAEIDKCYTNMKTRAASSRDKPAVIVAQALQSLPDK